jgi:hypothetical protein
VDQYTRDKLELGSDVELALHFENSGSPEQREYHVWKNGMKAEIDARRKRAYPR